VFQGLCSASGIDSDAVRIQRVSSDKGTGLFAARDIAKGDTVLRCAALALRRRFWQRSWQTCCNALQHMTASATQAQQQQCVLTHTPPKQSPFLRSCCCRYRASVSCCCRVPRSMCIVIDNDTGAMTIPAGDWPRLSGGLMQDNALTCEQPAGMRQHPSSSSWGSYDSLGSRCRQQ
jgi:hypothetical protein